MNADIADTAFSLFSPLHIVIIIAIPVIGALLTWISHGRPVVAKWMRIGLGVFLTVSELAWYAYLLSIDGLSYPEMLPLHLCDILVWVTVYACFTMHRWSLEWTYFCGIACSGMAILTPDLHATWGSWFTVHFFGSHGMIVATSIFLALTNSARLNRWSMWRALLYMNLYAIPVGIFNLIYRTNYMYLMRKPAGASVLDYFGPWPVYLIAADVLALVLFALLWLPFRKRVAIRAGLAT